MNIHQDQTKCQEYDNLVVSPACTPPDTSKQVRLSKLDPFAPSNSVEHVERPRYGQAY
jgi:hypothetical protein